MATRLSEYLGDIFWQGMFECFVEWVLRHGFGDGLQQCEALLRILRPLERISLRLLGEPQFLQGVIPRVRHFQPGRLETAVDDDMRYRRAKQEPFLLDRKSVV